MKHDISICSENYCVEWEKIFLKHKMKVTEVERKIEAAKCSGEHWPPTRWDISCLSHLVNVQIQDIQPIKPGEQSVNKSELLQLFLNQSG